MKMAKNTNLSTIESKKQTKQTSRTETESDMKIIWKVTSWEEGGDGEKGTGIKKYKLVGIE